jgi:hypothetical protein
LENLSLLEMKFFSEFLKWNSGFLGGGGRTLVQSNLSDRSEASAAILIELFSKMVFNFNWCEQKLLSDN